MKHLISVAGLSLSLILIGAVPVLGQEVKLYEVLPQDLDRPLGVEFSHEGSSMVYIVSRSGYVERFDKNDPEGTFERWFELPQDVFLLSEGGLLGLTFHPDYPANNSFFVYFTYEVNDQYRSRISRFLVHDGVADPGSEEIILEFDQPASNHNGGALEFGPDGYLYISSGDGGGSGSRNNSQDLTNLLGAVLRIDIDTEEGYLIPPDNPLIDDTDAMDEIYAWGLRNPWRMSFDPVTDHLWVADVGPTSWEVIHIVENGKNYGYPIIVGSHCRISGCDKTGLEMPIFEYEHEDNNDRDGDDTGKSITGGYVYRGSANPSLYGKYIYGDFVSGRIWALEVDHDTWEVFSNTEIYHAEFRIPSFGIDSDREIYTIGWGNDNILYRFEPDENGDDPEPPPKVILSEPEDGATDQPLQPELTWQGETEAESYDVQLATDSQFNAMVLDKTGLTPATFTPDDPLDYNTTYYWRVRGVNQAGDGEWSEIWIFTTIIGQPEVVNLLSPADGIGDIPVDTGFEWEERERADKYTIRVSTSDDFSPPLIEATLANTNFTPEDVLEYETTYYWQVRASNEGGDSDWSETWSFTTVSPPAVDGLVLNELEEAIELEWELSAESEISEYNIYRGPSVAALEIIATVPANTQEYVDSDLPEETSIYAVTAVDVNGQESDFSNIVSYYNAIATVTPEWKMVSIPIYHEGIELENSDVFSFSRVYQSDNTLYPKKGYWVKSMDGEDYSIKGQGVEEASLTLERGWNLIAGLIDQVPVESIGDPSGIMTSAPVYTYIGGSYQEVPALMPSEGHWIYASEEGTIHLEISRDISAMQSSPALAASSRHKELNPDRIIFSRNDMELSFWVTDTGLGQNEKYRYLLPPQSPDPSLDVRTEQGYKISDTRSTPLNLTSSDYPVGVTAETGADEDHIYRIIAVDAGGGMEHINLLPGQKQLISREYASLTLERIHKDDAILETAMDPGYPNPFNPAANIRYQLAQQADVRVNVYDVVGRRVATLVNEVQQPGVYTVQFDGSNLASGIYFLRLQAGSYVDVQKLTLIK